MISYINYNRKCNLSIIGTSDKINVSNRSCFGTVIYHYESFTNKGIQSS